MVNETILTVLRIIGQPIYAFATRLLKQRQASRKAMQGLDLSKVGSIEQLVKAELGKMAESPDLPPDLQGETFRAWILAEKCIASFVEVLIARGGEQDELGQAATQRLATLYEQATGETSKLASGRINLAISYVHGQLTCTESAKQAFHLALTQRNAVQAQALGLAVSQLSPMKVEYSHLQKLSAQLLTAGRITWKFPKFVASLVLEIIEEQDDKGNAANSITVVQLLTSIKSGRCVVLFGNGGIGKTTLMLELGSLSAQDAEQPPFLYVDAAMWALSGESILDYLASTPSAKAIGITSAALANFAESKSFVLMVNGWNEIPPGRKVYCRDNFTQLFAAAPNLPVLVSSRTAHDAPALPSPQRVAVRGLTWQHQTATIQSELGATVANSLLAALAKNTPLRHAARSPLILRGLIALVESGGEATASTYDLLGAVVTTLEGYDQRGLKLAEAPVYRMQEHYLEELACTLTEAASTSLSRGEALAVLGRVIGRLEERRQVGTGLQPADILEVLASHHVLHIQDDQIRFVHQRFQEYFAAAHVLRIVEGDDHHGLLQSAINSPAWIDSITLVAEKNKGQGGKSAQRAWLVGTAATLDLTFACEVAGLCGFQKEDDGTLHARLVSEVGKLNSSSLEEVRDLAVACQITSRFPAFSSALWPLLESDDHQTRLHVHRLSGTSISLTQLGTDAEARIFSWPSDRLCELIHEISDNVDNYDFIAKIALTGTDHEAKIAAISSLFWSFPASNVAIKAWLDAPIEVQTESRILNCIESAMWDGMAGDDVRDKLRAIASQTLPDDLRLRLASAFPEGIGSQALDLILTSLGEKKPRGSPGVLVDIAKNHAGDTLQALALELIATPTGTPEWVGKLFLEAEPQIRETAFNCFWDALCSGKINHVIATIVGPLSSVSQTERSLTTWLTYCDEYATSFSDSERALRQNIGYLLANAPGDDLLSAVLRSGVGAQYKQAVALLELLLTRVSQSEGRESEVHWQMMPAQFDEVFNLFNSMHGPLGDYQDKIFAFLACIASHVAPSQYGALLLEAVGRHLNCWSTFDALQQEWCLKQIGPRPSSPMLGGYVINAVARWGVEALPGLLKFLSHEHARSLLPAAIGRAASSLWTSKEKHIFSSINTEMQEGRNRRESGRALLQPNAKYQDSTDEAANAIGLLLVCEVNRQLVEKQENPKWNPRQAEYKIGQLAGTLAGIPSHEIVSPLLTALGSGLPGTYCFVQVLRCLINQGWLFSDRNVVSEFEAMYERETNANRFDDSKRQILAQCCQLMFAVEPQSLLRNSPTYYLAEWQKYAGYTQAIRDLANMKVAGTWARLTALGVEFVPKAIPADEFVHMLAWALTAEDFPDFARLVVDGTLFAWCGNAGTVRRLIPAAAEAIAINPENLELLVDACARNASALSDALLGGVLAELEDVEEMLIGACLQAVDAGRANHGHSPANCMALEMFKLNVPLSAGQSEIYPRACNELRQALYARAKVAGAIGVSAQRILAALELERREQGRPTDEPRHPALSDGSAWTNALMPYAPITHD